MPDTAFATLYRELVLDHGHSPRHAGTLAAASHAATLVNPLCGDRVELQLRISDGHVADVAHRSEGCLLCLASVSLLACDILQTRIDTLAARADALRAGIVTGDGEGLGDLGALAGVGAHPARQRCVLLAWETLAAALAAADAGG